MTKWTRKSKRSDLSIEPNRVSHYSSNYFKRRRRRSELYFPIYNLYLCRVIVNLIIFIQLQYSPSIEYYCQPASPFYSKNFELYLILSVFFR